MSAHGASAGRAQKCTSGDGLTMPAPARVVWPPVPNQLGNRVIRSAVANQCLRGRQRLRCIFRTDAPRWPNRATGRHAPAQIETLTVRPNSKTSLSGWTPRRSASRNTAEIRENPRPVTPPRSVKIRVPCGSAVRISGNGRPVAARSAVAYGGTDDPGAVYGDR